MTHLGPSLRRRPRAARPWRRAALAVVISVAVNLLVLREVRVDFIGHPAAETVRPVALAPLTSSQWAANRSVAGPHPAPSSQRDRPPPLPPPPTPPAPSGQVVDVAPSKDSTPPKDSRFLAEHNSTVEKETRSRFARPGYAKTLPAPSQGKPAPPPKPPPGGAAVAQGSRPGSRAAKPGAVGERREAGAPREREKLALNDQRQAQIRNRDLLAAPRGGAATPGEEGGEGEGSAGRGAPLDPSSLMPSAATYDRLSGGPAPDHLEGVEEGDQTLLNTREWKYAGYFNRIKQAVASHWDPNRALMQRDPTGNLYAYKDRITVVAVTLDSHGTLKDVAVQKTCGVEFLDRTAIDAFRAAQPFVNPPTGLADASGEIRFTFGFYLEVGSSALRFLRTPMSPPP